MGVFFSSSFISLKSIFFFSASSHWKPRVGRSRRARRTVCSTAAGWLDLYTVVTVSGDTEQMPLCSPRSVQTLHSSPGANAPPVWVNYTKEPAGAAAVWGRSRHRWHLISLTRISGRGKRRFRGGRCRPQILIWRLLVETCMKGRMNSLHISWKILHSSAKEVMFLPTSTCLTCSPLAGVLRKFQMDLNELSLEGKRVAWGTDHRSWSVTIWIRDFCATAVGIFSIFFMTQLI